jgi:hypothetical protein
MRELILKYGIAGGIIISAPMFIIVPNIDSIGFDRGETILFTTMIISFLAVYLGIGANRKRLGGNIGFRDSFTSGLLISVVISTIYIASYMLIFYKLEPGFIDKLNAFAISQMKTAHYSQKEIDAYTAGTAKGKDDNLFVIAAMAFIKPLTFGLFFTLSSSLILRKKDFTTPSAN